MTEPQVLVFDLGGVLLHLNEPQDAFDLQMTEGEFLERWIHSPSVRDFERGVLDEESFAKNMVAEAGLPYDWREFIEKFYAWPDQLYPGTLKLLDGISSTRCCALLSNTNAMHWERAGIGDQLTPRFERLFLSYVTGQLKPDPDAFHMVQKELGCKPQQIVFFDDNPANVDAAEKCGWQSILTKGFDDLLEKLKSIGVTT